ncbi:MAG: PLP-dependent aspartate aminotransferase family protein [Lachnospiraceae bacterium]|nr:PLP-dependent aspartate aminotransferase family protein [Lachnospiraceae bacterium]
MRKATQFIHGGISRDVLTGAVNVPIYQTSTFAQTAPGEHKGYEYSRSQNPTREALEALIADLENGTHGFAFASGLAAISTVLSLFNEGDEIIVSNDTYGGTFRLLDKVFRRFGIKYTQVNTSNLEDVEQAIHDGVKAIYVETPTNPLLGITDLSGIAEIAKRHGILSIVDNTFYTPYIQRPLDFGIDIVIHSATKYLGGHSDLIAGLVVVKDETLAENVAFLQNSIGAILQPFDSFLLIRGIKTLGVRLDRHVENAEKIVEKLVASEDVKKVYYPNLKTHPGYEINRVQARNGGAMISFELNEGHDLDRFFRSLKVITLAESLGGVESLIEHPASMTHASIPKEIREKSGLGDGLIRLSVGIEDVDDLMEDLFGALEDSRWKTLGD